MSISLSELNPKGVPLTPLMQSNLKILHERMNKVRVVYDKVMIVTNGVRSVADHRRIYSELAKKRGLTHIRVPMGSMHLKAAAVDIYDPDGSIYKWCEDNEPLLLEIGLWVEMKDDQKRVHFQCFPYGSWAPGKTIFFKP